jgi:3-hydroxyisobutyrate dehydrogenase
MIDGVSVSVAVLGTGIMGGPMARNLAAAGHEVRVWNRTEDKARALEQDGARVARSPRDAARGAEVLVTMLADADAVEHVMCGDEGALFALGEGAVWAQMSTVGLAGTERLAALAAEEHRSFVDAPVLGTKQPAEAGELLVFASGPQAAREPCAPVFDAVGRATRWLGEEPGLATRAKLVLNAWVLELVGATAEVVSLARALELDPQLFLEAIQGSPLDSAYARTKGKAMIEGTTQEPSFPLALARKDIELVREAASARELALPMADALADSFARAEQAGFGGEDMAAVVRALEP